MKIIKKTIWRFCAIAGLMIAIYCFREYIIMQSTQSTPAYLTLSDRSSINIDAKQITLKNYVGNKLTNKYVLSFENEFYTSTSRKYKLPKVLDGLVEVVVELERPVRNIITKRYDARDLYLNGLLIYFDDTTNENKYIYFVSGNDMVCYYDTGNYMQEWEETTDYPRPKKFFLRDTMWEFADDSWKNNKFRRTDISP